MAHNPDRASHWPAIEKRYGMPMSFWFEQMEQVQGQKYPEQMAFLQETHGFSRAHANALVQYCRGSTSSRRFNTLDDYVATVDAVQAETLRSIFTAITSKYKKLELVIAWNQPMLKSGDSYVFGASALKNHLLIAPFDAEVIDEFRPRLADYVVNKKTIRVPSDWKVDVKLLRDLVGACLARARVSST